MYIALIPIYTSKPISNTENTHYQFFSNMTEKRHMDGVVATGDALTSYYRQKASLTEGTERAKFEGLYEFLDKELPHCGMYLQINHMPMQSVYNHPNAELAVESMEKCKQTKSYYADGKSNKSFILFHPLVLGIYYCE